MMTRNWTRCLTVGLALLCGSMFVAGCNTLYYNTMEKLGYPKRDLLVKRVTEARDAQRQTKEQFKSALERFTDVVKVAPSELSSKYNRLQSEYDRSAAKAKEVKERIAAVEDVAGALFKEWKAELKQYGSRSLREASERKMDETRERYDQYLAAMKRAEQKIEPVLTSLHDQVLFLKHNLNAQAVASLQSELSSVELNTSNLIREMEAAIREADEFLKTIADK